MSDGITDIENGYYNNQETKDWMNAPLGKPEKKQADGIVSYFESPLALREQHGKEMKLNLNERMQWYARDGIAIELLDYIKRLEKLLCGGKGS